MLRLLLFLLILAGPVPAAGLRVAVHSAELSRDGPGLIYRDLTAGTDAATLGEVSAIAAARADVLVLCGLDWDHDGLALAALAAAVAAGGGPAYPYRLALRPNTGMPTGLDLDGDGRLGGPADAQGFGAFAGQGGMAILSRLPAAGPPADHAPRLWRDLPGAEPLPPEEAPVRRLSTTGHWVVPLRLTDGRQLTLMTWCAGPPAFGRGRDNIRRNRDETAFWGHLLDGAFGPPPAEPFVIAGSANLDPVAGDGDHEAIRRLIADPRLTDPRPRGPGEPPEATVDWTRLRSGAPGPGRLRTEYLLPARGIRVIAAAVIPPGPEGRHAIVTADLDLPPP